MTSMGRILRFIIVIVTIVAIAISCTAEQSTKKATVRDAEISQLVDAYHSGSVTFIGQLSRTDASTYSIVEEVLRIYADNTVEHAAAAYWLYLNSVDKVRYVEELKKLEGLPLGRTERDDAVSSLPTALEALYNTAPTEALLNLILTMSLDGSPGESLWRVQRNLAMDQWPKVVESLFRNGEVRKWLRDDTEEVPSGILSNIKHFLSDDDALRHHLKTIEGADSTSDPPLTKFEKALVKRIFTESDKNK